MEFDYKKLIDKYKKKGYKTVFFSEINYEEKGQLLLRHDIDLDISYALEVATIENKMEMKSTFFFLLASDSYNIFSKENREMIKQIKDLGHKISLHYDPTIYDDYKAGLEIEVEMFQNFFREEINIISLHRPNEFFLNYDRAIAGIEHTYMSKYFKEIKYIADSQGLFRYDHPTENQWFEKMENIQLLTHPIWWDRKDSDAIRKINDFISDRTEKFKMYIAENNIPFKNYLNRTGYKPRLNR